MGRVAVLVPIKAFTDAKVRLAPALPPVERAGLARAMAEQVLRAAAPLPVAVVCDDAEVAAWASEMGARVVAAAGRGLNGAVEAGVDRLAAEGFERVTVAHADLPLADDLTWPGGFDGVTLVPDRRHDGTNVISVPTASGFRFSYGPASLLRHFGEALRLGLAVQVVEEAKLAWDIDTPDDLALPTALAVGSGVSAFLPG